MKITRHDYFAGLAMQELLGYYKDKYGDGDFDTLAEEAFEIADAMTNEHPVYEARGENEVIT